MIIDIETLPADWSDEQKINHARTKVPGSFKKQDSIDAWVKENADACWRETALDWRHLRLLCASMCTTGTDDPHVVYDGLATSSGVTVLDGIYDWVTANGPFHAWVGWNVAGFDIRVLHHHALRLRHPLAKAIPFARYDRRVVDLMNDWNGVDPKGFTKLADVAAFLGIEGKSAGLDGSKVLDAWIAGEHERIIEYSAGDARLEREVWQAMSGETPDDDADF
jgi:hypothetical protein